MHTWQPLFNVSLNPKQYKSNNTGNVSLLTTLELSLLSQHWKCPSSYNTGNVSPLTTLLNVSSPCWGSWNSWNSSATTSFTGAPEKSSLLTNWKCLELMCQISVKWVQTYKLHNRMQFLTFVISPPNEVLVDLLHISVICYLSAKWSAGTSVTQYQGMIQFHIH